MYIVSVYSAQFQNTNFHFHYDLWMSAKYICGKAIILVICILLKSNYFPFSFSVLITYIY